MTKRNITMQNCIQFAHFCQNEGISPNNLATLCGLVHRRITAQQRVFDADRDHRDGKLERAAEERAAESAKKFAATLGYEMHFSCTIPHLEKNGRQIHLDQLPI
jgi:chromosome segregation and condensation protein ScpB